MNKKGFTLIELLVVIAIIGILSALAVVSLTGAKDKANDAKVKSDLSQIATAAEMQYAESSDYSGTWAATALAALGDNPCTTTVPEYIVSSTAVGAATQSYRAYTNLCTARTTFFCVDSTGFRGTTTAVSSTAILCR